MDTTRNGNDLRYVAARKILLDALEALAPHRDALIVAGAQAVYLNAGSSDIGIAPYTTDGDLALDPTLLGSEPELEQVMRGAGFELLEPTPSHPEPGIWVATVTIDGSELIVPVDLIVPEGVAPKGGRRGARLGPHGKRAARRSVGLEAALVDNSEMTLSALDPSDSRKARVQVAGPAALIVSKAHKIHDRLNSSKPDRASDKDAADVFRLMQTTSPKSVAKVMSELRVHPIAGEVTTAALTYFRDLFQPRSGRGVQMAVDALRLAQPEDQVRALCTAYSRAMLEAIT